MQIYCFQCILAIVIPLNTSPEHPPRSKSIFHMFPTFIQSNFKKKWPSTQEINQTKSKTKT